jgi:hypothetical protein
MIEEMQKLIFKFIKHLNMHLDVPGRYRGIQLERNSHHPRQELDGCGKACRSPASSGLVPQFQMYKALRKDGRSPASNGT